jgi:hypothetical protein
MNLNCGAQS